MIMLDRGACQRLGTRARLLAAGRRVVGARGLGGVAIADIAEEADVAVGSFYNYFRSKQDFLDVVTADEAARLGERLERLTAALVDPAERIAATMRHLVSLVDADPAWAWFVVRVSEAFPPHAVSITAPIERDVRAGIASGRFSGDDPTVAVHAVGGALLRVMRAKLTGPVGSNAHQVVAEQVLRLLGLSPAAARAVAARPRRLAGVARAHRRATRWSSRPERGVFRCPSR